MTMAPPDDGGREARTAGLTKQNDSRESQWRHQRLGEVAYQKRARQARDNRCTDGNHVMHNMIITRKLTRTGRQSATHAHVSAERGRGEKDLPRSSAPPSRRHPGATRGRCEERTAAGSSAGLFDMSNKHELVAFGRSTAGEARKATAQGTTVPACDILR